jgi:hypothetical protein
MHLMPSSQELLYIVLGIGVAALLYPTLRDLFKKPNAKKTSADDASSHHISLPLKLQAYERLTIYIDRMAPQNLINRLHQSDITVVDMQIHLVSAIKGEFEHNVSQQIYVSKRAWEAVKTVKDQTIALINQVAGKLPPDASGKELNRNVLKAFLDLSQTPHDLAQAILQEEAQRIM